MPTYEYRCKECGHEFDAVQAFTDDALTECPVCEGALRKVFGNVGITFKGSGFYKNDSRSGSGSSSSSSGDSKSGDGKGSDSKGSDSKGSDSSSSSSEKSTSTGGDKATSSSSSSDSGSSSSTTKKADAKT